MQTRSGSAYAKPQSEVGGWGGRKERESKRRRGQVREDFSGKRRRCSSPAAEGSDGQKLDLFDGLPDDIVVCILCKLSSSAACPADLINILLTYHSFFLNPSFLTRSVRFFRSFYFAFGVKI